MHFTCYVQADTLKLADVCSMLTVVYMTRLIKLLITYDGHIVYGMRLDNGVYDAWLGSG